MLHGTEFVCEWCRFADGGVVGVDVMADEGGGMCKFFYEGAVEVWNLMTRRGRGCVMYAQTAPFRYGI